MTSVKHFKPLPVIFGTVLAAPMLADIATGRKYEIVENLISKAAPARSVTNAGPNLSNAARHLPVVEKDGAAHAMYNASRALLAYTTDKGVPAGLHVTIPTQAPMSRATLASLNAAVPKDSAISWQAHPHDRNSAVIDINVKNPAQLPQDWQRFTATMQNYYLFDKKDMSVDPWENDAQIDYLTEQVKDSAVKFNITASVLTKQKSKWLYSEYYKEQANLKTTKSYLSDRIAKKQAMKQNPKPSL